MSLSPDVRRPERADAARNRERILTAAERLFREHGVEAVSMDRIARAAGVGKATVFRRFGDRAGLALALLDQRERDLQAALLRGPEPVGPGAPPGERIVAFLGALVDLLEAHTDLIVASETASRDARYRSGLYATYHLHLRVLIAQAHPDLDADLLAENLLASLSGEHFRHLRRTREMDVERIRAGVVAGARALLASAR